MLTKSFLPGIKRECASSSKNNWTFSVVLAGTGLPQFLLDVPSIAQDLFIPQETEQVSLFRIEAKPIENLLPLVFEGGKLYFSKYA